MRKLTKENFNTLATRAEIEEALDKMRRHRHVNRLIVYGHLEQHDGIRSDQKYALTLGKLHGLASPRLGEDATTLAKKLGVTVEHPVYATYRAPRSEPGPKALSDMINAPFRKGR